MQNSRIIVLVAILTAGILSVSTIKAAQIHQPTWRELTTPPEDSIEAENTRIWVPVEHKNRCRFTIDIYDSSGVKVRTLFDALLGEGYYNFWWNKMNDSLELVPAGEYRFVVADQCGSERNGTVTATYKEWERKCHMTVLMDKYPRGVNLDLFDDSARVSAEVRQFDGDLVDAPFTDTVLSRGFHRLYWRPADSIPIGRYKMTLTVGDYSNTFVIRCAR